MRTLALLALLSLCACQPLPHPFAEDVPPPNSPMLTPPDSVGVTVDGVAGAPGPAAADLAADMAKALRDNDVPASATAGNRDSYHLTGSATTQDLGGGNLLVTVAWEMRSAGGALVHRQDASLMVPATLWRQGGGGLAALARAAAPGFAGTIESTAPKPLTGINPLIVVRMAAGAPGDGAQSLARAMADALRRAQVQIAGRPDQKADLVVAGKVDVSPRQDGKQEVKISWSLQRPDGEQIGQVQQQNAVSAGSLEGPWGLTAYEIANAAAPGITALIAEMQRNPARS